MDKDQQDKDRNAWAGANGEICMKAVMCEDVLCPGDMWGQDIAKLDKEDLRAHLAKSIAVHDKNGVEDAVKAGVEIRLDDLNASHNKYRSIKKNVIINTVAVDILCLLIRNYKGKDFDKFLKMFMDMLAEDLIFGIFFGIKVNSAQIRIFDAVSWCEVFNYLDNKLNVKQYEILMGQNGVKKRIKRDIAERCVAAMLCLRGTLGKDISRLVGQELCDCCSLNELLNF